MKSVRPIEERVAAELRQMTGPFVVTFDDPVMALLDAARPELTHGSVPDATTVRAWRCKAIAAVLRLRLHKIGHEVLDQLLIFFRERFKRRAERCQSAVLIVWFVVHVASDSRGTKSRF